MIGGLGFITLGTAVSMMLRRKIGLKQRGWIRESFNVLDIGGVVRLIRLVLKGTLLFEGIGAIILAIRFFPRMGLWQSIYYGVFHSVSAFCNAGFDLMGRYEQFSSLTAYYDDPVVTFTICALILYRRHRLYRLERYCRTQVACTQIRASDKNSTKRHCHPCIRRRTAFLSY